MTNAYTGALFQLGLVSNPNSTLDVGCAGATVRGTCAGSTTFKADMTTWSTFCGGVANNCFVKKIYAQIHRHPNDLAFDPSAHPGRALFSIDSTTRLPLLANFATEHWRSGFLRRSRNRRHVNGHSWWQKLGIDPLSWWRSPVDQHWRPIWSVARYIYSLYQWKQFLCRARLWLV